MVFESFGRYFDTKREIKGKERDKKIKSPRNTGAF
jgi:hypothetical protein